MPFKKLHEGADKHRGVEFKFTILQTDDVTFSELNYTLPDGPKVEVAGTVPFPTIEHAVEAVKQHAAVAIDQWLDNKP